MKNKPQSCATCCWAKWARTPKGRIIAGVAGECGYPLSEMPRVPASVKLTVSREPVRPDDGADCQCFTREYRVFSVPTPTQISVLEGMAAGRSLTRSSWGFSPSYALSDPFERITSTTVEGLVSRKLIEEFKTDWRVVEYRLTDAGQALVPAPTPAE